MGVWREYTFVRMKNFKGKRHQNIGYQGMGNRMQNKRSGERKEGVRKRAATGAGVNGGRMQEGFFFGV